MAVQVEAQHAGEFVLSEGNGRISRDSIVLAEGEVLGDGAVLGQVTADQSFKLCDPAADDGSQEAAALLYGECDASAGAAAAVAITRMAEVKTSLLHFKAGMTDEQKAAALAQLAARMIIAR